MPFFLESFLENSKPAKKTHLLKILVAIIFDQTDPKLVKMHTIFLLKLCPKLLNEFRLKFDH